MKKKKNNLNAPERTNLIKHIQQMQSAINNQL